jgi:hypothetical protein
MDEPPGAGGEGTLSTQKEFVKPGFGGCGMVSSIGSGRGGGPTSGGMGAISFAVVFLLPLFFALEVRAHIPRLRRNKV